MGVVFTKEQKQVIDLRNRNILVSAAAGSGKTAVLVERIITRLTKDKTPLDVDQLLIVTFTEAAAAEMKERIHAAIEKALEAEPGNVHLQRQATLIHQAQITTIHQFCLSVIRDYFHTIDLDPGFRVGDEGELKLLKKDTVEKILEEAYREATPEFLSFVEGFASGRDDRKLEDLILQIYEFSRSHPNPKAWLSACVNQYNIPSVQDLEENPFVQEVIEEVRRYLEGAKERIIFAKHLCQEEDGPRVYETALDGDLTCVQRLLEMNRFSDLQRSFASVKWDKLGANRDKSVCEKKIQAVKSVRDEVKKMIGSLKEQYFFADISELQEDIWAAKEHVEVLCRLVSVFADAFSQAKQSKNLIDFNDMEQYALQILTVETGGKFCPSEVAGVYQQKFEEIMIDEYQDSNLVQEAILTSVSRVTQGTHNIFMVGDVKQSIYRFRLSRPELFMEKFHSYSLEGGTKQRIDLHKNFRSRKEVLESTNFIFEQIMTKAFGGISYDDKAALYVGADYEDMPGNETEVLLVEAPEKSAKERAELEAVAVATRIKELMINHQVKDKKTGQYRKVRYNDIVILSRSLKSWTDVFVETFQNAGIPTYTGSKEGYFQTQEIQLILNYLKILDNPRQDIPLTAVLTSMLADFSNEELAIIRCNVEQQSMYESLREYEKNGENEMLRFRVVAFMEQYEHYRDKVPYLAIHVLLGKILEETGYADYVAALPRGEQRAANLQMLIAKAVAFEKTSYKGLFHFVRYVEQLEKYNIDYSEANITDEQTDAVCLMSIHKSKGLEFPIVFVTGLGKQFNQQDTRQSVVLHPDLGAGIDRIDTLSRTKNPTLIKKIVQQKTQKESIAEELRVLYVAMTRAKEKLILTGGVSNLEKEVSGNAFLREHKEVALPYYNLAKANKYFDWILPALFRNVCFSNVLENQDIEVPFTNPQFKKKVPIVVRCLHEENLVWGQVQEVYREHVTREILEQWNTESVYDEQMKTYLENQFSYRYPFATSQVVKQKVSVSELKKKAYMDEEGDAIILEEEVVPLLPKFSQEVQEVSGASRGSAYHKVLEMLDFAREYEEASLERAITQMQEDGYLSEDMVSCIRTSDILHFLHSPIGQRVRKAERAGTYYAEQPFVMGLPAERVYEGANAEEYVLIQGIIDVYFEEDGELVVLDYKTDRVQQAEQLVERYQSQLHYYAEALERLCGKKVKEKIIYSFALHKEIKV